MTQNTLYPQYEGKEVGKTLNKAISDIYSLAEQMKFKTKDTGLGHYFNNLVSALEDYTPTDDYIPAARGVVHILSKTATTLEKNKIAIGDILSKGKNLYSEEVKIEGDKNFTGDSLQHSRAIQLLQLVNTHQKELRKDIMKSLIADIENWLAGEKGGTH